MGESSPLTAGGALGPEAVGPQRATHLVLGYEESCAVLANGSLACWGRDDDGQLGDGAASSAPRPFPVLAETLTGVARAVAVSAGSAQTYATLSSGDVVAWGDDFFGELGNATRVSAVAPSPVVNLHGVTSLAGAVGFACAVIEGGAAACWGTDAFGELGDDGALALSPTPIAVAGVSDAAAVAAGQSHACALLASGSVACWGANDAGQLGPATAGQSARCPWSRGS